MRCCPAISFIIIIVFAQANTYVRMRMTLLLAGDYNSKTGIKRTDEIGDLAKTIDILSKSL